MHAIDLSYRLLFLPWFLGGGVVGHVCFVCLLFIFYITLIVIYEHFAQYKNFQAHIIMSLLKSVHVSVSNTYIRRKKTSNQRIWILNQDFNQHPVFTMNRDTMYKGLMWIKFWKLYNIHISQQMKEISLIYTILCDKKWNEMNLPQKWLCKLYLYTWV